MGKQNIFADLANCTGSAWGHTRWIADSYCGGGNVKKRSPYLLAKSKGHVFRILFAATRISEHSLNGMVRMRRGSLRL